ncbi:non-heme iron oxygenase ferredoxin subunit [Isosphaeraceae bacterium EP7]
MPASTRVASLSDIPADGKLVVEVEGRSIALFSVDGTVYALDDVCTHDGGPLAEGRLEGCVIECPRHGAKFDVRTGRAVGFPAFEAVPPHDVVVRDGSIYVTLND